MQLKEENGTYRISLADAKQKIEGLVRSQASYPPEVDQILNEMKADLDKKDARIIGLTKDLCAANSKLEVCTSQVSEHSTCQTLCVSRCIFGNRLGSERTD